MDMLKMLMDVLLARVNLVLLYAKYIAYMDIKETL
jgi:hypothetical protein